MDLPKKVTLKDGRIATIDFLSEKDSVRELQRFINALVKENTYIHYDRKVSLKEEEEWKKKRISDMRKREGYVLIAKMDGKIAGSSGAQRERLKGRNNIALGIVISRPHRGLGLGKALLTVNISTARKLLKPNNIYLSLLSPNKRAYSLYKKLGFEEFAIFPKWLLHNGKYVDQVFLKLKR